MGTLPWLRFGCLFTWKHPDGTFPVLDQQQQRVYNGRFYTTTVYLSGMNLCVRECFCIEQTCCQLVAWHEIYSGSMICAVFTNVSMLTMVGVYILWYLLSHRMTTDDV